MKNIVVTKNSEDRVKRIVIHLDNGAVIKLCEPIPGELEVMNGDGKILVEGNSTNVYILHCEYN
jgi:hypothetical protein